MPSPTLETVPSCVPPRTRSGAIAVGLVAGALSTVGYVKVQPFLADCFDLQVGGAFRWAGPGTPTTQSGSQPD
jgi:hypothetical protein